MKQFMKQLISKCDVRTLAILWARDYITNGYAKKIKIEFIDKQFHIFRIL